MLAQAPRDLLDVEPQTGTRTCPEAQGTQLVGVLVHERPLDTEPVGELGRREKGIRHGRPSRVRACAWLRAARATRKVTEAMRHPAVTCLSHPKGRIINHRPPNTLDLERVFAVALETGVGLETNGLPDRLDLSGPEIRLAIEAGVPIVASTDAHSIRGLGNMRLAIATARRGWAKAADVVNTRPLAELPLRQR